jgi:hypothetical protein
MITAEMFHINDQVKHKVFGQGIIQSVDEDVIKIEFEDTTRTMSIKAMLKIDAIEKVR